MAQIHTGYDFCPDLPTNHYKQSHTRVAVALRNSLLPFKTLPPRDRAAHTAIESAGNFNVHLWHLLLLLKQTGTCHMAMGWAAFVLDACAGYAWLDVA